MLEKKNKLMRPSIDLTEPRICRVVEICDDEGLPLVRGSKVTADGVEIVTIGTGIRQRELSRRSASFGEPSTSLNGPSSLSAHWIQSSKCPPVG